MPSRRRSPRSRAATISLHPSPDSVSNPGPQPRPARFPLPRERPGFGRQQHAQRPSVPKAGAPDIHRLARLAQKKNSGRTVSTRRPHIFQRAAVCGLPTCGGVQPPSRRTSDSPSSRGLRDGLPATLLHSRPLSATVRLIRGGVPAVPRKPGGPLRPSAGLDTALASRLKKAAAFIPCDDRSNVRREKIGAAEGQAQPIELRGLLLLRATPPRPPDARPQSGTDGHRTVTTTASSRTLQV